MSSASEIVGSWWTVIVSSAVGLACVALGELLEHRRPAAATQAVTIQKIGFVCGCVAGALSVWIAFVQPL